LLFVFVLTWHIFERFGGESVRPPDHDTIPIFYGAYIFFAIIMVSVAVERLMKRRED
jgi:hypothetical protein